MSKVEQKVMSHFRPLFEEKGRYFIIMGGRGTGRSTVSSQYVLSRLIDQSIYTRGAIMRAVSSDIRSSCWRELTDRIVEQGINPVLRIVDNDMFVEYGSNSIRGHGFKASSGSLTARLKSLANYNLVWIDEAEEIGEDEFRTLDDTLRTLKGDIKIILSLNTPPKNHWILRKWFDLDITEVEGFYKPRLKPDIKDVVYIPGNYRENEVNLDHHTIQRYKDYQYTNPAYYWQVIEGLSPEEVRGKIFSGWQQIDSVPREARLVKFGLDWGWFPDPVSVCALYYYNGSYYVKEVIHGINIEDEMVANAIKNIVGWRDVSVVCGADEPKSIEMLKKYGIRAEATDNRKGSVNYRIKATSTKKIFVTKDSPNIWHSYENYAWAEDKDGNPKGEPNHAWSDPMDAVSYAAASINPISNYVEHRNQQPRQKVNIAL
jgi:phage terminase large subunit